MKRTLSLSLSFILMSSTAFSAPIDLKKPTELNEHYVSSFASGADFNLLGNQQLDNGIAFNGGTLSITGVGKTISAGNVKTSPYADIFVVDNTGNLVLSGKGTGAKPGMLTLTHSKGVLGSAIYIKSGGNASLENVIIKGNTDKKNGAGLYIENANLVGSNLIFDSNILKPDINVNVVDVATVSDGGSVTGAAIIHNFTANSSVNISGNVDFKNNQALAGNGQNNTIKTDGISNTPIAGLGGNVVGGVVRILTSNASRASYNLGDANSKVSFTGNKSIAGKGGDINFEVKDVELDTNDLTAGNGGNVVGGVISANNTDFTIGKNLFFEKNLITAGAGGSANLKTETFGSVTAGRGGVITGGLVYLKDSKFVQTTNNSNLLLKGNTVKAGNGGTTSDLKNAIVTSTSGDGGLISGGLIEIDNSELKTKWLVVEGNTINSGSSGAAPKATTKFPTKEVVGGVAGRIYGGLIGLNANSSLQVGDDFVLRSNKINAGTTASVKNMAQASVNDFNGIQGGLLYAEDSYLKVRYRTIIDKNIITMKPRGSASTTMGDSKGGDGGFVTGALMFFKNSSLLANSNFEVLSNKLTLAAGGGATSSKSGDAEAGSATHASGLLAFVDGSTATLDTTFKATGNIITGGKGGNAVASNISSSLGGNGSSIYGGVLNIRESNANFNGDFIVDANTFTAGAGGTASKVGGTGGKGGSVLGGALAVIDSSARLTGEKIIITNNKITSGKGGVAGTKGEDGYALGAAIYVEGNGTGKVTFGDGIKDQYIFISGNMADGKANSFFLNNGTELEFNLNNKSLADVRDPIRGNSSSKITKKGMGTLLAWGNNSDFYGSMTIEGGIFGLRNTAKEMGVWGAVKEVSGKWLVTSGDITVKNGGYLSVHLDSKRGASQIRANKFTFESGAKVLPVGIFLQNKGIKYTYNNFLIQNGTGAPFNLPSYLTNYADANNIVISIPTGSGSTSSNIAYRMEVTRKKEFTEAFGLADLTIDKYIKTLDINTMAMFDKAFIEGSSTDANKLVAAYNAMKTDKKKKMLNQVTVAKTGVTQISGLINAYAVGSGPVPFALNSYSSSNNKTGNRMWLSSGKNDLTEVGTSNDVEYVTLGFDKRLNKNILVGMAMQTYDGSVKKNAANVDDVLMTGGSMAMYGSYKPNNEYILFNAVYDFAKTNQTENNGLISGSSDYDTRTYKLGFEVGNELTIGESSKLTPYVGFDYTNHMRGSYKEKSSNGRSFSSMNWDSVEAPIGLRFSSLLKANEKVFGSTYFDIGYVHNFGDISASTIASVSGNGHSYSWKMKTEEIGRDMLRFKTGFDFSPAENININLGYKFEGRSNATDQVLSTDFKYRF